MKKLTLLFLFLSLCATAQVFPDLDVSFLKPGMKVKTRSGVEYDYKRFYEDESLYKIYKNEEGSAPYKFLDNRVFEIIEIKPYESSFKSSPNFSITLKDVSNQEVVYYKYIQEAATNPEITPVENIDLPLGYFCSYIEGAPDAIILVRPDSYVQLYRMMEKGKKEYFISLKTGMFKQNSGKGTITLNLKNAKKIVIKNCSATGNPNRVGDASYEARVKLTEADLRLIEANEIESFDFFGLHVQPVHPQTAGVISGVVDCFIKI